MAGRYIPPHMRGSAGPSAESPGVEAERKPEDGYTLEEIANQYSFGYKRLGTLNRASNTVEEEGKYTLGFVILFKDQHPKWPPKIFCKTNLFLLPKTDTLPSMYMTWDDPSHTSPNIGRKTARLCLRSQLFLLVPNIRCISSICSLNKGC